MSLNPDFLETYITLFRRLMNEEISTAFAGEIVEYDRKKQKASIKPLIERRYADGSTLTPQNLPNVPVIMPRGNGLLIKIPVVKGDYVLCICTKQSLDEWLAGGLNSVQSTNRQFNSADAIAIPGLVNFKSDQIASNDDNFEIIYGDASIVIDESSGQVNINNGNLTIDV